MTQINTTNIFKGDVKLNDNLQTYEYTLMYYYGCWVTKMKIYAENDAEAIYDAEHSGLSPKLTYALFQGNRKVKEFNDHKIDKSCNFYK